LQELQASESVSSLYRAATVRYDYLKYNDSTALAIKCVWALSKIGTDIARKKLEYIAETDERDEVRIAAHERLSQS
jgi:hypothetical protein